MHAMTIPTTQATVPRYHRVMAVVGVAENGNSAVLVTIGRLGGLLDRRTVELTHNLPTHPHHHEGSWAIGRYANSAWAKKITLPAAIKLVERVRTAAARGAREALETLATSVPERITGISLRACAKLPATTKERIVDARAAGMADSILYREALAAAAKARGWSVHWYERNVLAGKEEVVRTMGRTIGAPWRANHKLAAAAALASMQASKRSMLAP
jgi:hypothetical protein